MATVDKPRGTPATSADEVASKAAAKPTINVEVIATRDWDEGVNFVCTWEYPQNSGIWHSGKMVFADGDVDRDIEYTLVDRTGLGLAFASPANEAIWVNFGTCPTSSQGSDKGQIHGKNKPAPGTLTVKNKNNVVCKLKYALNFVGTPYSNPSGAFGPPYQYDPEYRNGGGGGSNA
jgi:hypothetical protein